MTDHDDSENVLDLVDEEVTATITIEEKETENPCQSTVKVTCPFCDSECTNNINLKAHIEKEHMKTSPEKVTEGIDIEQNVVESIIKCNDCGEEFLSKQTLDEHVSQVHTDNSILQHCRFCKLVLTTLPLLKDHESQCHKSLQTSCGYCDFVAIKEENLKEHMFENHE